MKGALPGSSVHAVGALRWLAVALAIVALAGISAHRAFADTPEQDVANANALVHQALIAAAAGDLSSAQRAYTNYDNAWTKIEDGVSAKSRDNYRAIETQMGAVQSALGQNPPDRGQVVVALTALDQEQQRFIQGLPPLTSTTTAGSATAANPVAGQQAAPLTSGGSTANGTPTVATLLDELQAARTAQASGDYATASAKIAAFEDTWLDVEGQISTRSPSAYHATESDMELANTDLAQHSPEAQVVLERMDTRLEPYRQAQHYGIFDASIILLREGLEALLVMVALLAFLKKSGNAEKGGWIWGGASAGLLLSIVIGVAIQILFHNVFSGSNRELIEGGIGLVAAGMLLYVSYWMHSKTSVGAWQRYIRNQTTAALATGSLFGLGALAFLAVFREGAETVLFFLGMAGNISTADLLIGLGIGAVFLAVMAILLTVVGVRIPMRPFFAVASLLTFYLCFKFLGTGIQSLQVAGLLPATSTSRLPDIGALGLFPTWQTTIPQLLLLSAGIAAVLVRLLKDHSLRHEAAGPAVAAR